MEDEKQKCRRRKAKYSLNVLSHVEFRFLSSEVQKAESGIAEGGR